MPTPSNRFAIATALALSLATAGGAWAQTPSDTPVTGLSTMTSSTGEAKVTAVDQRTRMLTLTTADGRSVTHKVSDGVQNFGRVKVGDTIVIWYEERTSYVLSGPNTKIPGDREATAVRPANVGKPAGAMMRQEVGSYTVVGTDVQANTIRLVEVSGGEIRTYNVNDPNARAALPRVKPGDYLTIIERQVLIGTIVPKP